MYYDNVFKLSINHKKVNKPIQSAYLNKKYKPPLSRIKKYISTSGKSILSVSKQCFKT